MMQQFKIFFIGAVILFFGAFSFFNSNSIILAQSADDKATDNIDIQYPIKELGGCKNKSDCKKYCDNPKNIESCLDFAEKQNLMSEGELESAKKFIASGKKGPGGCTTKDSCENYCNDLKNIDECLTFAEKSGIMGQKEFEEAKKVKLALEKGAKLPGGCTNKKGCDDYCSNSDNIEECVNFAETAGFMPEEELREAKKVVEAIKTKGIKPPSCRGKEECEAYCGEPEHFEECITFAEAAGFMTSGEAQIARKTGGKGPGGCKGREECDQFCQKEGNFETCLGFAKENGLVSEEDANLARKTGGKGPGGCKGEKECREFCENPDNQETCFSFAKENNLISEQELEKIEEGKQQMKESFTNMPQEISDCLNSSLGSDFVANLKEGSAMPSPKIGEQMRACFEKMGPPGGMMPRQDGTMPGDEMSPLKNRDGAPKTDREILPGIIIPQNIPPEIEECLKSTTTQPDQNTNERIKSCFEKFGVPAPQIPLKALEENTERMPQGEMMPPQNTTQQIQCQSKEECEDICRANPEKCPGFHPEGMAPPEAFQKPPEGIMPLENMPLPGSTILPPPDQSFYPKSPEGQIPQEYQQYQQSYPTQPSPEFNQQQIQQSPEGYYQIQQSSPETYKQQTLPIIDYQTTIPTTSYNRPPSLLELTASIVGLILRQ